MLFFDSIWLGITLIATIIAYAAVGSAVPPFRQYFELTEFQYFNHWLFATLIGLFCFTLIVTTVRRIPLNPRTLGVLTVHTGLIILCSSSILYFGRKIEGDVWLEAPRVRVISLSRMQSDPQRAELASIAAFEGNSWESNMPGLGGRYRIDVTSVQHEGLLTGARVALSVAAGTEAPRTIELQQTPQQQQGFARLNDRVALWLSPANVSEDFYDDTSPVLMAAARNHVEMFNLPDLPYYLERFEDVGEPIFDLHLQRVETNRDIPIRPFEKWRMPIDLLPSDRAVSADWPITLRIDGYLPYARLDTSPSEGGIALQPIARVRLSTAGAEPGEDWLVAQMPSRNLLETASGASCEFRWIGDDTDVNPDWIKPVSGAHVLDVIVKDKNIRRSYDVHAGQEISVEGADYTLRVEELRPSWPLMTAGFENARTPIALIWVESPGKKFQRSVLQRFPQLNQDRNREGQRIDPQKALVDDNLELVYTDASRDAFTLVAGAKLAPILIYTAPGGRREMVQLDSQREFRAATGASLTLVELIQRPRFDEKPVVIPERNRREFGQVRRSESMVRLRLTADNGRWVKHVWVPFSNYNTEHDGTSPTVVPNVPGLGELRLIYGRAQRRMPAKLTLEYLKTDFYPGRQQPSGWTSYFRYQPQDGPVRRAKVFLNNTATIGEWTFYQSQAAGDHQSWSVLGVGNRQGVFTMLAGCALIALGMIYAFAVKPILVRRRNQGFARMPENEPPLVNRAMKNQTTHDQPRSVGAPLAVAVFFCGLFAPAALAESNAPKDLQAIADQIDVKRLGALATQYSWRYSTVDSWARDAVKNVHGSSKLFGLDPVVAAFELIFNKHAYDADDVIYIKDRVLRKDLTAHPVDVTDDEQERIIRTGYVSADFLRRPTVADRIERLSMDQLRKIAMDRLAGAMNYYDGIAQTCLLIPDAEGKADAPWFSLAALDQHVALENDSADAKDLASAYRKFKSAWLARDAAGINAGIADLERVLPTLAGPGGYPSAEMRHAEVTYRRLGLMRYAWVAYIFAFFISIFSLATRYGWVRTLGLVFLVLAVGLHGTDIAMRWRVIGRIPVANMYEAVTSSTWVGAVFGLILELFQRKRVYLLSAALLGFFALALPELLPTVIDNHLGGMMPILDDIMLRIHTVLIISSYAVITLAFGVANCYLFVSAKRERSPLAQYTIGAQAGAILCLALAKFGAFDALGTQLFVAIIFAWGAFGAVAVRSLYRLLQGPSPAVAAAGPDPSLFPVQRNILAEFDFSHRVLLYTAMVALFVGIVLGAVWADYSWGRPWGWDPKEVFALNTWLIYAILIHARFVTRRRALVTSVLSVIGFAAMQFNWWVVNFYIVGLHSYA